jgi:hypothetical protein
MKVRIILAILLVAMLFSVGCKQKDKSMPDPAIAAEIPTFAPLPSFKQVYEVLDQLQAKDISAAVPNELYQTKQEEVRNAFSLGLLTADAVLAAKGRNSNKQKDISAMMMNLTSLLGLESEVNRMGDDLRTMIQKQQWDELDKALDAHKKDVEDKLWATENYDNYTIMLLGGWVEAANRVAWLLQQNYDAERSKVLVQKGTFNHLVSNMKSIKTPHIVEQDAFKEALVKLEAVQEIINNDTNGTYTKEQIDSIIQGTNAVKAAFQN